MEIKKGDRFRCIKEIMESFYFGKIYTCELDGSLTDHFGRDIKIPDSALDIYFEKITAGLPDSYFIQSDSTTSPSHYKAYDVESIEMMIRIWGKEEAAIFCKLSAFGYRLRMGMKDDVSIELGKEKWFLNKWKELRDDVTG